MDRILVNKINMIETRKNVDSLFNIIISIITRMLIHFDRNGKKSRVSFIIEVILIDQLNKMK